MIEVFVKFYGGLHTRYPDLPVGQAYPCRVQVGATIAQLLVDEFNLPPNEVAITLINGKRQPLTYPLQAGDTLALFPPIAGG